MRRPRIRHLSLGLAALLACAPAVAAQDAPTEEFARRQYESGLAFQRDQKFAEALKDFQAVVDQYPGSRVADAALLRIAEYQLDVAGDTSAAQAAVDLLQKKYATTESGPMGLVLAGRITVMKGRAAADIDSALASYERVPRLFPGSDAVPASIFYAAEALRLTHRDADAVLRYRQVSTDYPQSAWAPRALLGEARCLVLTGRAGRAMELLQRVRQRFPGTPEAATAVAWNTILYRLYLRVPGQPAYQYAPAKAIAGTAGKLKDIQALAVAPHGTVHAATRNAVLLFEPGGKALPGLPANDTRAILFDHAGRAVLVCKDDVVPAGGGPVPVSAPKQDGSPRAVDDIASGVLTSAGDLLLTDRSSRSVGRFSTAGKYLAAFAPVAAQRLAIGVTDRVVALDQDGNGVTLVDHDGRLRTKIPPKAQGYEFDKPVDIAVDALGHIYLLDRNAATVFVFSPGDQPRLITAFAVPAKSPGSFRKAVCFALDAAARLYIYDDDAERIQVYQ
jgi:TolA-binding protein